MNRRPRYSTGCLACRRMKVKCDEGKPGCARCVKAGRTCPGSLDIGQVMFVSMNEAIADRVQLQKGNLKTKSQFTSSSLDKDSHDLTLSIHRPRTDWAQNSVAHFFRNFVSPIQDVGHGYLEFLPNYYAKHRDCTYLNDALLATAMSNLANISCDKSMQIESLGLYGRALKSVSTALTDPEAVKSDRLLIAITLLQKHETFSGSPAGPVGTHERGLVCLIRKRRSDPTSDSIENSLAKSIYFRTQIRELGGEPPYLPRTFEEIHRLSAHEIENQLWLLLHDTSRITAATHMMLSGLVDGQSTDKKRAQDLLRKGLVTRSQLVAWIGSIPAGWKYDVVPNVDLESADERGSVLPVLPQLITFKDQNHAGVWIGWWLARIQLARRLLQLIGYLIHGKVDLHLLAAKTLLQEDIHSFVDMICASSPFLLGDVDQHGRPSQLNKYRLACPGLAGYYLAHGMDVSNWMPGIKPDVRRFVLDTLFRVGHSKGINHALLSRKNWLEAHPEYDQSQLRRG